MTRLQAEAIVDRLPALPRVAQTISNPWTPIAMEEKAAVAVVDRGGGGKVKGSLDTLDIFE